MQESSYDIHGVSLRLAAGSPAISSVAQTLLRRFERESLPRPTGLQLCLQGVRDREQISRAPSSDARLLFSWENKAQEEDCETAWRCDLYADGDRMIADLHAHGLLVFDDRQSRAEGFLVEPEAMHPEVRIPVVYFALTELLRRHGLGTVHATALEKEGRGVLIPGDSGRGKTTCCLSLLRGGFRCLSDDHPFFRENGAGIELLSFPVKIDVTEETIAFFPELRAANGRLHPGVRKRFFFIEEIYPDAIADRCQPALILLPQVIDWPTSSLEPLPKSRALEELLRQGLRVWDRDVAARQFRSFSRLVESAACYRLYFGEDVLDLPRLIEPLLRDA